MFNPISRKQAGVIYRNYKEGKVTMSNEAVSMMYAFTEPVTCLDSFQYDMANALKDAITAIFANDLDEAQAKIDRFCGIHNMHYTTAI